MLFKEISGAILQIVITRGPCFDITAFMLFVAFRYYQQSILTDDWVEEDEVEEVGDTCQASIGKEKHGSGPLFGGMTNAKQKKKF